VAEGAKSRILLETRLKYTESINVNLSGRIQQLEAQLEKQNKKITKKEVNTSDTF
jgi:CII-binding regulator of phage lambda lysogenization HflD